MKQILKILSLIVIISVPGVSHSDPISGRSLYDLSVKNIDGEELSLSKYRGKVLLITNTALKCATTPQFEDLQKLYEKYRENGFEILAFPSNDFTGAEPRESKTVKSMCTEKFGISFPLFSELHVQGQEISKLFEFITEGSPENMRGPVMFNFEKFLIDREGKVRARFGSFTNSMSSTMNKELKALLNEGVNHKVSS